MTGYILAIDQGTTNSRAIVFDKMGNVVSSHDIALEQFYPHEGWVEQDPEEIFKNTVLCCQVALQKAKLEASSILAVGICNQRETTILWEKTTGKAIYPAIIWQDRRTAGDCQSLSQKIDSNTIQEKTGLLLDPYFSATKIHWILQNIPLAYERAQRGELLFGTVDSYLIWRLTKGKSHLTDITNASRTLLFNIKTQEWDESLLKLFDIPSSLLPKVMENTADFGEIDAEFLGTSIPITASVGDQQGATVGQACFQPGMVKATYGTGCFVVLNTGDKMIQSNHKMLATIAYKVNGNVTYALEGSIFCAGVTIKWLRDTLKLITTASETESIAGSIPSTEGVYLVPAFTGLGAPYWDPAARGALLGLTRNSSREHIIRAALESVAYQTRDLLYAMQQDAKHPLSTLRVDGGMTTNNWLMQFLANMIGLEVQRPICIETSALGAAYLAGLQIGIFSSLEDIAKHWRMEAEFAPDIANIESDKLYRGWKCALAKVLSQELM